MELRLIFLLLLYTWNKQPETYLLSVDFSSSFCYLSPALEKNTIEERKEREREIKELNESFYIALISET